MLAFLFCTLLGIAEAPNSVVINGYTNVLSAFPGDSVELYLNASNESKDFEVRLFTLQGKVVGCYPMKVFPQTTRQDKPYEKGFGYKMTSRVVVPKVKSGVYLWENQIPFIVKARNPKIAILYPSNTECAYNNAGGKSLYGYNSSDKIGAAIASFHRPVSLPKHAEAFFRWIEFQDLKDVGYLTDMDMDDYREIKKSELLILPGHSEYWTWQARKNFDRFVHSGKNALVLSGNTMWWQVRYNQKKDQLICYRKAETDPIESAKHKTINWNEVSLDYSILSSLGADFSYAGYGLKTDKGWNGYKIISQSPLLEGTSLLKNDILPLPSDELDGAPLKGFVEGVPELDLDALSFAQAEIVGYDLTARGNVDGVATWIVFRPAKTSGIVINTASTDWCSYNGIGKNEDVKKITLNMIHKLLNNENVFFFEKLKIPEPVIN